MKTAAIIVTLLQSPAFVAGVTLSASTPIVTESGWLTGHLVIGATCGSFLAVAIWLPHAKEEGSVLRRLLVKFGASMFGGYAFGPGAVRYLAGMGMKVDSDTVLLVGGVVSLLTVATVHFVAAHYDRWLGKWIGK